MCCRCITLRLIEEICLIDQLSNGRFEVGVGRGTDRAQEWRMWGGDASENDARFEETLEVVLKGLQCEFLSHSGQFYNFSVSMWPRATTRPASGRASPTRHIAPTS
jgi:alkanesulfonate monooxygenase SsuD/methylene tetrahydromethanopterin reductase-like flavin-dependent oxidoreductase (luciferase family)